ncbi:histidinol dehydrogenase [Blattabacterium cuenoti]|uniref:histidinol dehydrogenase n=1 Tax=Blattabacterium cuenoti TaxID=1653831 RepID=UPI00163C5EFD|nr:histidinol dehydrogenase [Blattabacterium cuenoti]
MDIKTYFNPPLKIWEFFIKRKVKNISKLTNIVLPIIDHVKKYGDLALKTYTRKYDYVNLKEIKITEEEITQSNQQISDTLKEGIHLAYNNIKYFHENQIQKESKIEISSGIFCWRKTVPIEKVGFYIPGGTAPLLSTVLMLGVPSKLSGCKDIIICTPPNKSGKIHPSILYIANKYIGIHRIYKVGGSQAIAAMAYGTETIPSVYKIFGPGNSYVTLAKQIVANKGIVSIDVPAGPSEIVILADKTANPEYVVSDLISQSEHDPESYILLISIHESFINQVKKELKRQLTNITNRFSIIKKSLEKSRIIFFSTLERSIEFINQVAPEHLIINCHNSSYWGNKIKNAGSVFLGNYSPVSAGDYATGTNHILPTYGYAKSYSGVSVDSFIKKITFQRLSKKGLRSLSKCIEVLSSTEGLIEHKRSINIRLKNES